MWLVYYLQHDSCDITATLSRHDRRVFYSMLRTLIVDLDVSRQLNLITFMGLLSTVKVGHCRTSYGT